MQCITADRASWIKLFIQEINFTFRIRIKQSVLLLCVYNLRSFSVDQSPFIWQLIHRSFIVILFSKFDLLRICNWQKFDIWQKTKFLVYWETLNVSLTWLNQWGTPTNPSCNNVWNLISLLTSPYLPLTELDCKNCGMKKCCHYSSTVFMWLWTNPYQIKRKCILSNGCCFCINK